MNLNPPSSTNPISLTKRDINDLARDKFIKSFQEYDWSTTDNICIADGPDKA